MQAIHISDDKNLFFKQNKDNKSWKIMFNFEDRRKQGKNSIFIRRYNYNLKNFQQLRIEPKQDEIWWKQIYWSVSEFKEPTVQERMGDHFNSSRSYEDLNVLVECALNMKKAGDVKE